MTDQRDYILDTGVISALLDPGDQRHSQTCDIVRALDHPHKVTKYVSVVSIGELTFGVELAEFRKQKQLDEIKGILEKARGFLLRDISHHVAKVYGIIRGRTAIKYMPRKIRSLKWPRSVTEWFDEITDISLQINENDLWIVAQAAERDLILVTTDKGIQRIIKALPEEYAIQWKLIQ